MCVCVSSGMFKQRSGVKSLGVEFKVKFAADGDDREPHVLAFPYRFAGRRTVHPRVGLAK